MQTHQTRPIRIIKHWTHKPVSKQTGMPSTADIYSIGRCRPQQENKSWKAAAGSQSAEKQENLSHTNGNTYGQIDIHKDEKKTTKRNKNKAKTLTRARAHTHTTQNRNRTEREREKKVASKKKQETRKVGIST